MLLATSLASDATPGLRSLSSLEATKWNEACEAHETCDECTTTSTWCHWCDFDNACHSKGSIYGCRVGSTCGAPSDDDRNKTDDGCSAHKTCRDCALSSHTCHWCAHDNACHVVGSVYGCAVGVDCYSNERCRRMESEPITDFTFYEMGPIPMMVTLMLASTMICCATICYGVAGCLRGAYDDLIDAAATPDADADLEEPLLLAHESDDFAQETPEAARGADEDAAADDLAGGVEDGSDDGDGEENAEVQDEVVEETPLVTPMASTRPSAAPSRSRRLQSRRSKHMNCLFAACSLCYYLTVGGVIAICYASFRYFPKRPAYNICNDAVAWNSIIDSLASLNPGADFQLLASVANPNHFDVALDMGGGSFRHNGVEIGQYTIPPVTADAMSITDVMVIAHLSADKWDALSLTAEYYRGKLVLNVDAAATIRVPFLFDYSFEAELKNLVVHVNEMSDRHLCSCPTWSDNSTIRADALFPWTAK